MKTTDKPKLSNILSAFPYVLFFPLIILGRYINPKNKISDGKRTIGLILSLFVLLPLWGGAYGIFAYAFMYHWGFTPIEIDISGTGSMYPTFPKGVGTDPKDLSTQVVSKPDMYRYPNGIVFLGKRYFSSTIGHGDIVVVSNNKIKGITTDLYGKEATLVKRVIALPGDTIQIRSGIVYLNDAPQKEPYIAHARSTFGGQFLPDCQVLKIPAHKYFIMGDNRKVSGDSRQEVGLVDEADIRYDLPYVKQIGKFDVHWHDATDDLKETAKITLDVQQFTNLLNEKRETLGAQALRYEPRLSVSAAKRGTTILKYNDFSFDATRSGYTMSAAVSDAGYSNIVYGEEAILGYYEAQELIDNLFEFPTGKKFLTDTQYNDVGVAEVDGFINSCPAHLIMLHFGGYVPPNYSQSVIDSWTTALTQLKQVEPGWKNVKTFGAFYTDHREDIDRLIAIISQRITGVTSIVARMKANQWLTPDEQKYLETDKTLETELDALTKKVNSLSQ